MGCGASTQPTDDAPAEDGAPKSPEASSSAGVVKVKAKGAVALVNPSAPIKILHYNIYIGQACDADNGADLAKLENLKKWLAEQDADIVGLCECNGWEHWDVDTIKNALGYPHGSFQKASKDTRAHVMVLSKQPIEVINHDAITSGVYFHALLHVKTYGINIMETHLCPRNAAGRLKEIVQCIKPAVEACADEPCLLMGDMNSIMPSSRNSYVEEELIAKMRVVRKGKLIPRHTVDGTDLQEGKKTLESPWAIDYRPLEEVSTWMDEVIPAMETYTYPSTFRDDQQEDPKLRIDGVFVNKALAGKYDAGKVSIINTDPKNPDCEKGTTCFSVEKLSDHYPCLVTLTPK
jgi:endonuclease/exonuclease/phosphatase family metal-dependent hydrolase